MTTNTFAQLISEIAAKQANLTTSDKGAPAYKSTLSAIVDLNAAMGALRGREDEFLIYFQKAVREDFKLAVASLFKLRDIRKGMGERDLARNALLHLERSPDFIITKSQLRSLLESVVKYGRWDDIFIFKSRDFNEVVARLIADVITDKNENQALMKGLLAKWLPRKPKVEQRFLMSMVRSMTKMSPKALRKWCVENAKVVEQQMSANQWSEINYSHVPSQAARIYSEAFLRHDESGYSTYLEELNKPKEERKEEVKVNAGAMYPYQAFNYTICNLLKLAKVVKNPILDEATLASRKAEIAIAKAQWEALPNFLEGVTTNILPMVDVSGSMECPAGGKGSITCMDVAASLGAYISERSEGTFKNLFLTFSGNPTFIDLNNKTFEEKVLATYDAEWGMNTDIKKAYTRILDLAVENKVPQEELPEVLLILSDMNFDYAVTGRWGKTELDDIKDKFKEAGYTAPKIVFWNLNHNGTFTCTINDDGVCQVSGFSPAIMVDVIKSINDITPESVTLKGLEPYLPDVECLKVLPSLESKLYVNLDSVNVELWDATVIPNEQIDNKQ